MSAEAVCVGGDAQLPYSGNKQELGWLFGSCCWLWVGLLQQLLWMLSAMCGGGFLFRSY
jgi:hypothetical protein